MANLTTKHMGISLKNPIILGASNLVGNVDNLKKAEDAGIAAIVYRSLFEEQIQLEGYELENQLEAYDERHAEMINLFPNIEHAGPKEHLYNLRKAKESVSVPVIASINAVYKESWVDYAKQIEETGVDGIELNFFAIPRDMEKSGHDIIAQQLEWLKAVKSSVKIPVSVKLSPFYTNILKTVSDLDKAGADGVVLFNRLFEPDIDVEAEKHAAPWNLSTPSDHRLAIRYIGLLHGNIKGSIVANNGVYEGADVVKMILAGADAVESVSTFYHNGIKHIKSMLSELEEWMDRKGYKAIDEFRGNLSSKAINDPFVYKRAQYIDMILKSEDYFNPIV
ncbi:MAG: dihydroorotate dehydrogenase-like protein [Bacteroidales bacterium]|nr:dihydroorotate dehydrogenase-like protein [Bacteroidales bacterium]MDT8432547.1 dihydroorotate dehydrogenase-like protein [Bacteroidales bacterium]